VGKRIVVNAELTETRIAVQEGSLLTELFIERHDRRSIVGSVYKGVVTNVLPGMQAAFVDLGLAKDAFLYGGDYTANTSDPGGPLLEGDVADPDSDGDGDEPPRREASTPIEELLRKGQTVLVQVSKEPLGSKGARVTSFISIPGRYLVYMPQARHVGVSRRIHDEHERDRLRGAVRGLNPPAGGYIVRTNAEGKGEDEFAVDIAFLGRLWNQVQDRFERAGAPAALHEEMDLAFRVVRDLFSPDVEEFIVDTPEVFERCVSYARSLVPTLVDRVHLYEGALPLFESLGIEKDLEKALRRRVWLRSGGYIVIDQTEALVSIDVNTGKYVGKRDFEQTVLKINLESVAEIVRQIRLRDLGGIIIIDFIDMEREEHREQVYRALKRALVEDKARTNVLPISELGLVEMTRKRVRQDLRSLLTTACPACQGAGVTKTDATLAAEVFRALRARAAADPHPELVVRVHPELAAYLEAEARAPLEKLAAALDRTITVQAVTGRAHRDEFEVLVR
jgi:ribonuclease G